MFMSRQKCLRLTSLTIHIAGLEQVGNGVVGHVDGGVGEGLDEELGIPGQARAEAEAAAARPLPQPPQCVLKAPPRVLVVQLHALQARPARHTPVSEMSACLAFAGLLGWPTRKHTDLWYTAMEGILIINFGTIHRILIERQAGAGLNHGCFKEWSAIGLHKALSNSRT